MYIRIGNYEVSVWLFVIIGIIIVAASLFLFFLLKRKESGGAEIQKYKRITSWQRKHLNMIIDEDVQQYGEDSGEEYTERANLIQAYINRHREWNKDELLSLSKSSLQYLTVVILENVDACIKNEKNNTAVLLLCALDYIHGGSPVLNGKLDWLGSDLPALNNHREMSVYEGRLLNIYKDAVAEAWSLVDEELGKIPETVDTDNYLKELNTADFSDAYNRIEACVDIKELTGEPLLIVSKILNRTVQTYISTMDEDGLKYYQLYYIRALACSIEKKYRIYEDILESLNYD